MKVSDLYNKEFLKINYSGLLEQMKKKGISEIQFIDILIHTYTEIYDAYLKRSNKINQSKEGQEQLIFYRIEIEELKEKKRGIKSQNALDEKLETLINTPLDLSETSAVKKIIYLHELGILKMLGEKKPESTNVNALAEVLSAITGEKCITLQPYLNPIFKTENNQDKNPLLNEKNVAEVKRHLLKKGFKPLE